MGDQRGKRTVRSTSWRLRRLLSCSGACQRPHTLVRPASGRQHNGASRLQVEAANSIQHPSSVPSQSAKPASRPVLPSAEVRMRHWCLLITVSSPFNFFHLSFDSPSAKLAPGRDPSWVSCLSRALAPFIPHVAPLGRCSRALLRQPRIWGAPLFGFWPSKGRPYGWELHLLI